MKTDTQRAIGKAVAGPLIFLFVCAVVLVICGLVTLFSSKADEYPPGALVIATDPPIVYVPSATNEPISMLPLTPPFGYDKPKLWSYGTEPTYPQIVLLRTYLTTNVVAEHWTEEIYRPGFKAGNWEGGGLVYTAPIHIPATTNILTNYVIGYIDGTNLVEVVTTFTK